MAQQLCGINAVFYYSTMFFDGLIENPLTGTTLVATVNVIATVRGHILHTHNGTNTIYVPHTTRHNHTPHSLPSPNLPLILPPALPLPFHSTWRSS